jgi:hypothetical protein
VALGFGWWRAQSRGVKRVFPGAFVAPATSEQMKNHETKFLIVSIPLAAPTSPNVDRLGAAMGRDCSTSGGCRDCSRRRCEFTPLRPQRAQNVNFLSPLHVSNLRVIVLVAKKVRASELLEINFATHRDDFHIKSHKFSVSFFCSAELSFKRFFFSINFSLKNHFDDMKTFFCARHLH